MESNEYFLLLYPLQTQSTVLPLITFIASTLGMTLSILAMTLLILTAVLFPEWRNNYKNQLLIQFILARFLYTFTRYFYDIIKYLNVCERYFNPLYLGRVPMAYTEMALVSWMYVFSKQMYDSLARIFNIGSPSLWKVSLCAWLIPVTFSVLLYITYCIQNGNDVQIYILYLFFLKWPALCANGIILVSVLRSVLNTNKSKTENNPRIILVMITLIFTFCFQQAFNDFHKLVFVIFHIDKQVSCQPLFFIFTNIITIYQCAFSILFWLFANKRTRVLWGFTNEQKERSDVITCSTIS